MSKRHTDTDKWTNNRWFQRLPGKYKLLWFYMWDMCDNVGVWSADLDLAMLMLGPSFTFTEDEALEALGDHVEVIDEKTKEWWIIEYCEFHHADFCEKCRDGIPDIPEKNNALRSYFILMNQHHLWDRFLKRLESQGYTRSIRTPLGKERLGKVRQGKEKKEYAPSVHMTEAEYDKLVDLIGKDNTRRCIDKISHYKGASGKTYKDDYRAILNWTVKEVTGKDPTDWEADKERKQEEERKVGEKKQEQRTKEPIPDEAQATIHTLVHGVGKSMEDGA